MGDAHRWRAILKSSLSHSIYAHDQEQELATLKNSLFYQHFRFRKREDTK